VYGVRWLIDREGYHESRRCSRDTYPESHITKYTKITLMEPLALLSSAERASNNFLGVRCKVVDNAKRFRERLVFKAHRLMYHSTLVVRVIKKKDLDGALSFAEFCRESIQQLFGCTVYGDLT